MDYRIGCDAHKRYSVFAVLDSSGQLVRQTRINHEPGAMREFLADFPEGTPVALESLGNWHWIVDEIERAGCTPVLTHAAKAKVTMGNVNKSDKLDAKGVATLLHLGSLRTVWLPPSEIRDERELHRTRMALSKLRAALKNRVRSTLAKYALSCTEYADILVGKGRAWLKATVPNLPAEPQRCVEQQLRTLDAIMAQISTLEERIAQRVAVTRNIHLLKTLPGVANILTIVIEREMGSADRFPTAGHFASYAGVVPKVHASGGKIRYGRMRRQCNQYLKWAFIEAANVVVRHRSHSTWRNKHVSILYERIRRSKGHAIAVGAVARHLAEAAFWMLKKGEPYKDPTVSPALRGAGKRGPNLVPQRTVS